MKTDWAVCRHYDADHLTRVALPLGGIGTGTVSLGGRGDLRNWELMNRPAKTFVPQGDGRGCYPSLVLSVGDGTGRRVTRLMEGPLEDWEFEGSAGCETPNHGLPRFRACSFDGSYPFGRVNLSDPAVPVRAAVEGFNPFIPCDADRSSLPVAILRITLENVSAEALDATVCFNVPNFIGLEGKDRRNINVFRNEQHIRGILLQPGAVDSHDEAWGTLALTTTAREDISYRTAWKQARWGAALLDYWDELSTTGALTERAAGDAAAPMASLAIRRPLAAGRAETVTFLLTWHFPNRRTWTPVARDEGVSRDAATPDPNIIGNHYCTRFPDAWAVAEQVARDLDRLRADSVRFVNMFMAGDLPQAAKEGALFNLSTLRSQTVFRTPDGRLYGWEGCCDGRGCCYGSCTHVWNYESATAFLFGELAATMREVEFMHATGDDGLMAFRVNLPLAHAREYGKAAADGQMGCIMKAYREWQLSGDHDRLRELWPRIRAALAFCWIEGGWDADRDGVMEGCQHNTMDVEYYGPNPQMQGWYLGALRAAEDMARHLGDTAFARTCRDRFDRGSRWMDKQLFNGEYYVHTIQYRDGAPVADGLRVGMTDLARGPENQLGEGCLIDQLVGQYMAHLCGLGRLHDAGNVKQTLRSILRYNRREGFDGHFNCMRSYALADETAMLMAVYPGERPENPFPYFTEVMTGFEWTAATGMLQEGLVEEALACMQAIRARYDGRRRNPYDEAECGHHYARAMAAWSTVPAWSGFHYSAVDRSMRFACPPEPACRFWASGYAWGTVRVNPRDRSGTLKLGGGTLALDTVTVEGLGSAQPCAKLAAGDECAFQFA